MQNFLKYSLLITLFTFVTSLSAAQPQDLRIVSVGGGATETITALGGEKYLVGVDISSTWPVEVKKLPQVGYQRTLAPEGILALKPTVLVGTKDSGPPATLEHLRKAGVKIMILPSTPTLDTVKQRIQEVAALLNQTAAGEKLWEKVQHDITIAQAEQKTNTSPKKVLFLLAVPGRAPLVAGKNTEADTMIQLAGGKNVVQDFEDYRVLTPEAIQKLNPDIILLTSEGLGVLGGKEHVWKLPGIKNTNAAKNHAAIVMDTGFLLNFGPRTGEAVLVLSRELQ